MMAHMDTSPPTEITLKALRRMLSALEGVRRPHALIGSLAHKAWGCASALSGVQLLMPSGEDHRGAILGAARGEGFRQAPDGTTPASAGSVRMSYADAKLGASADVDLLEAATPYLKQVLSRAERRPVFGVEVPVATCEDLILMRAGSSDAADFEEVIGLLRSNAGRVDAAYLKREAEAAGVFAGLKRAWQEAKQRG